MNTARLGLATPAQASAGLALSTALLAVFVIYAETVRSIISVWNSSETFAHGYIILPISLWLIWRRREALREIEIAPYWPALALLAACGFGWLLAELSDVQVVRQYAFVTMLPLSVLLVLGAEMSSAIAFPLFFLLLAVPFGEIFVAPLIDFTADFTVTALQATGIPVLRNGSNFEIPSGSWSVVEACSGVRYLISSFTLGCLYAVLSYRSRVRQIAFVLLSIIVPILANGIRAYMIVMIGHLSDNKMAVGVDHLIYGWFFFGLVMFLMFWIGNFWREDEPVELTPRPRAPKPMRPSTAASGIVPASIACIACVAIWPMYANYLDRAGFNPSAVQLGGFESRWQESAPFTAWRPSFFPASAELHQFFQRDAERVGVSIKFYRNQRHGTELISSSNRLVSVQDKHWQHVATTSRRELFDKHNLVVREARILDGTAQLLVWHWYWIDGAFTPSDYVGKLLQTKEKFLMRGDDGAAVMVFSPYTVNEEEARAAMRGFLAQHLVPLESALALNKKQ